MKKTYLRALAAEAERLRGEAEREVRALTDDVRLLKVELACVKEHWRPVPMVHEWQPVNPQCALCDEHRDAPRHRTDEQP